MARFYANASDVGGLVSLRGKSVGGVVRGASVSATLLSGMDADVQARDIAGVVVGICKVAPDYGVNNGLVR